MVEVEWAGVDWGTSNVRAYGIDASGQIVHQFGSQKGMSNLRPDEFEPALIELVEPWLKKDQQLKVFACGMVGARQGWKEAQYRHVPCLPVSAHQLTHVPTQDKRLDVHILPGLCQTEPANVMRGEETQIGGLLNQEPDFSGFVCLPGTHSKWAQVKHGKVIRFHTFMTGELYALISKHSVLSYDISGGEFDQSHAAKVAQDHIDKPSDMTAQLFAIRANGLLADQAPHIAQSTLSGSLIGQEIGTMKPNWQRQSVVLIGATKLTSIYEQILRDEGVDVRSISAADATIAGLKLVAQTFKEE